MINGGWKAYFGLENNCKSTNVVMWYKKKFLFETLVIPVKSCMLVRYGGAMISIESWRKIEQIHKFFINYNLKIKSNTP